MESVVGVGDLISRLSVQLVSLVFLVRVEEGVEIGFELL